jgi:hypothetical protein
LSHQRAAMTNEAALYLALQLSWARNHDSHHVVRCESVCMSLVALSK